MPAQSWTEKGVDREFLIQRSPAFKAIHKECSKGQRSADKRAWLDKLIIEYEKTFPGRIDDMNLPKVGRGGTPQERHESMVKRLGNYYKYLVGLQGPEGIEGEKDSQLLKMASTKGSRKEGELDAYVRHVGKELEEEIEADWTRYQNDCKAEGKPPTIPKPGRRNQFVSQKFKALTPEAKAEIRESRQEPSAASPAMALASLMDSDNPLTEKERCEHAQAVQGNINSLFRSLDRVIETIRTETGWNVSLLVGGPKPVCGGDIHVQHLHSGSVNGQSFDEKYVDEWASITALFGRFCQETFPPERRVLYSVEPTKEINRSPASSESSPTPTAPSCRNSPDIASQSQSDDYQSGGPRPGIDPFLLGPGGAPTPNEIGQSAEGTGDSAIPATGSATANIGQTKAAVSDPSIPTSTVLNIDHNSESNQNPVLLSRLNAAASTSSPVASVASVASSVTCVEGTNLPPKIADPIHHSSQSPSSPTLVSSPTQAQVAPAITKTPVGSAFPTSAANTTAVSPSRDVEPRITSHDHQQPTTTDEQPQAGNPTPGSVSPQAPVSEKPKSKARPPPSTRTTRSQDKDAQQDAIQAGSDVKSWMHFPELFLKEYLVAFDADTVVRLFTDFEKVLNVPVGLKGKAHNLDVSAAPPLLKKWNRPGKDPWKIPQDLSAEYLEQTVNWYLRLQPPQRTMAWPPPRSDDPRSWDWGALKRGGPSGICILLIAVGWATTCANTNRSKLIELVEDIKWVLGILLDLVRNPPPAGRKRKADGKTEKQPFKRKKNAG